MEAERCGLGAVSRGLGWVGGHEGLTERGIKAKPFGGVGGSWQRPGGVGGREGLIGRGMEVAPSGWKDWTRCRKALQIPLEQMHVVAPMPSLPAALGDGQRNGLVIITALAPTKCQVPCEATSASLPPGSSCRRMSSIKTHVQTPAASVTGGSGQVAQPCF